MTSITKTFAVAFPCTNVLADLPIVQAIPVTTRSIETQTEEIANLLPKPNSLVLLHQTFCGTYMLAPLREPSLTEEGLPSIWSVLDKSAIPPINTTENTEPVPSVVADTIADVQALSPVVTAAATAETPNHRRGLHWREKQSAGTETNLSKLSSTVLEWSQRLDRLEKKLNHQLQAGGEALQKRIPAFCVKGGCFVPPWRMGTYFGSIRSTKRAILVRFLLYQLAVGDMAVLKWSPNAAEEYSKGIETSFFGLTTVIIKQEHRPIFHSSEGGDILPCVYDNVHINNWTIRKSWLDAGWVHDRYGEDIYLNFCTTMYEKRTKDARQICGVRRNLAKRKREEQ